MVDLDNIFKFCTPKYVYIRDAKLGIMKYTGMLFIFFYVIVYYILYTCDHLEPHHAQGFGTINIEHPVDHCDPLDRDCLSVYDNIMTLPYCDQYDTPSGAIEKRRLDDDDSKKTDKKEEKSDDGDTDKPKKEEKEEKPEKKAKEETKDEKPEKEEAEDKKPEKEEPEKEAPKEEKPKKEKPEGPQIGDPISPPKTCRYLDSRRLEWSSNVPSEIFIPTRYRQIKQTINPDCYNPELHSDEELHGKTKYRCKVAWTTSQILEYYVADIEDFNLKLEHSFSSPAIGKFGVSTDFQGLFAACKTNHPLDIKDPEECKRAKVPNTAGAIASEDAKGLVSAEELGAPSLTGSTTGEDVISFGDFLRTTPVAQDYGIKGSVLDAKLPDKFGHPGKSLREEGGMLLLDVNYDNTGYMRPGFPGLPESFQIKPITYSYRPYFVPSTKNEKYQLVEQSDHADYRIVDIWYGVTVKMQFNGQLVVFSWSKVLHALTSGLVLLSMATTLVCYAASYVMPLNEKYNGLMYQISEDFTEFSELRKNKLGQSSEVWKSMASVFASGTIIMKHLAGDGTPKTEDPISNDELVTILCLNEMRLNRLDAMDTRMIYDGLKFTDVSNYKLIQKTEQNFYKMAKAGGRGPAE